MARARFSGLLDVLGSPRGHIAEDQLFCDPAAKRNLDVMEHLILWY